MREIMKKLSFLGELSLYNYYISVSFSGNISYFCVIFKKSFSSNIYILFQLYFS